MKEIIDEYNNFQNHRLTNQVKGVSLIDNVTLVVQRLPFGLKLYAQLKWYEFKPHQYHIQVDNLCPKQIVNALTTQIV